MIHSTAIVEAGAELGEVEVGAYAVIGRGVRLHDGVRVGPHAVIEGDTEIGPRTVIHAHAVLGGPPQDKKHDPEVKTTLRIGADNVFREFSTAHRGTAGGRGETVIGDRNYFMASSHVAHDCIVGNDTMFANSAAIAGHVDVADGAVLGGLCAVHQHARIGRLAMIGGGAMCAQDVPPFTLAQGDRARLHGVNIIGLRRAGLDDATFSALKDAWRTLFVSDLPRKTAIGRVEETWGQVAEVRELIAFLRSTTRGVCRSGVASADAS
ncbi:MAG: acyl-ACP--UDP-N-acetylglucosamine O-acyltransferase [Myxococcota bacterium]